MPNRDMVVDPVIPPYSLSSSPSDKEKERGVRIISLTAVFFAAPTGPPGDLPSSVQPRTKRGEKSKKESVRDV